MNPQQFRRARDLFEQALEQEPPDVAAWLARESGPDEHDEVVRAEVLSLLEHHSGAGSFLSAPVVERLPDLLSSDRTFDPGTTLGSYTIQRELGRGGMGHVYLAIDAKLGRTVALKALASRFSGDPSQRERLRREARAAALLTHPGICTVYALEEIDGELYIASEFIEGRTLREEIAGADRPSLGLLVQTARELSDALAAAHAKGVTHRDLKPENVMRAGDGRLKILDFGLARLDAPSPDGVEVRVTQPGTLVGTPAYMAPEQLKGEPADARTDVFALGIVLYEYACGAHPFEAPTPLALAARVLESDVRPIESIRPDVPASFAAVIERCLRKAPSDRFRSAGEVALALTRGGDSTPVRAVRTWWRGHQLVMIGFYFLACVVGWRVKEWRHGFTDSMFLFLGVLATIGGVFRGHLVFTERVNRGLLAAESRLAVPALFAVDLLMAAVLLSDGVAVAPMRPLIGVLTIALAVGIALARLVVEPATTRGAFDRH